MMSLRLEQRQSGGIVGRPELQQILVVKPRSTFCLRWQARESNDLGMVMGSAGSSTHELLLTMEIDRLDAARAKSLEKKIDTLL